MNRDINYVLDYMVLYTKDKNMQYSEPMLNHNDIETVLKYIYELERKSDKYKEVLDKIKEIIKKDFDMEINDDFALESIYKLLEEIE